MKRALRMAIFASGGLGAAVLAAASAVCLTSGCSTLGYYEFDGVKPGRQYSIAVTSKRFRFLQRMIEPSSSLAEVNFIAQE